MHRPFVEARAGSLTNRDDKAEVDDSDEFDDAGVVVLMSMLICQKHSRDCLKELTDFRKIPEHCNTSTSKNFKLAYWSQTKGPSSCTKKKAIAYDHLPNSRWNSWISNGIASAPHGKVFELAAVLQNPQELMFLNF
jgi:hypothetical protein